MTQTFDLRVLFQAKHQVPIVTKYIKNKESKKSCEGRNKMKFRSDYITNSSSSSFVVSCAKINDEAALRQWLESEYGKKGNETLSYIVSASDVLDEKDDLIDSEFFHFTNGDFESIEYNPEAKYIFVWQDIEGKPASPAAVAYDICTSGHNSLDLIFADTWSGFNG